MTYFAIFLVAFPISMVCTWLVIKFGKYLKVIDDPATHPLPKVVHKYPVPRGGGIAIFVATSVATLMFLPFSLKLAAILLACLVLVGIGLLDDRSPEGISPYWRAGINVLVALLIVSAGIQVNFVTNPLGGIIHFPDLIAKILTVLWLVWMQNIVGWSSGVDGQLPGFVAVASLTMAVLAARFTHDPQQILVIGLAVATAGAYLGFLPFNWYPQKIMPGYGGKAIAGFLLGILAILSSAKVGAMILVLGIPFVDAIRVFFKRIAEGRSPVRGGYEHLHHYLLDKGWGKRRIAIFYWVMSGLFAIPALQLQSTSKYFTMASVFLSILGIILWLQIWHSTFSKPPGLGSGSKT